MVLRLLRVALSGIEPLTFDFATNAFEVRVDDVRGFDLLVVVFKPKHILTFLRHFHPVSGLADPVAIYLVSLQQIHRGISVQAADTEVCSAPVLILFV